MNKEWYKEIPENGVLCKKQNGEVRFVKTVSGKYAYDSSRFNGTHIDDLTPLTAQEWWEFAPWLDMKSAPLCRILILDGYGNVVVGLKNTTVCSQFINLENREIYKPVKWLPLPEVNHE